MLGDGVGKVVKSARKRFFISPLHILQQLNTPRIKQLIIRRVNFPPARFRLIILQGAHKDPVELESEVEGVLGDYEGELLEGGGGPVDFEVDYHVGELGKVELDSVEDQFFSGVLWGRAK